MLYQTGKESRIRITIEYYGQEHSTTLYNGSHADELQEAFDRLLVLCGYSSDIRCADGGHYELHYVSREDERGEVSE